MKKSPWRWWAGSGLLFLAALALIYMLLSYLPFSDFPGGGQNPVIVEGSQPTFTMDANVNYWVFQRTADQDQAGNNCSIGPRELPIGVSFWFGGKPDGFWEGLFYQPPNSVSYKGGTYFYGVAFAQSRTSSLSVSCPGGPVLVEAAALSWSRVIATVVAILLVFAGLALATLRRFRSADMKAE